MKRDAKRVTRTAALLAGIVAAVSLAGCARAVAPPRSDLAERVASLDEAGYEGGLSRSDVAIATALAERAFATGIERRECGPPDPMGGQIVASTAEGESPAAPTHPVLAFLDETIRTGNRRQRDIALFALSLVGPGSEFTPERLQALDQESPWAREALTAISCDAWAAGDIADMWSADRSASDTAMLDFAIEQMLDAELRFPSGVFGYALDNRGLGDLLTIESVARLVPVLESDAYPVARKAEAIRFIRELGEGAEVFEAPLHALYETHPDEMLREDAGRALAEIRSPLGGDMLADFIEAGYHYWWWARPDCVYPPHSSRFASALMSVLTEWVDTSARGHAAAALGCIGAREAIPALSEALETPFWSVQAAALRSLARFPDLPPATSAAVEAVAREHWSSIVREAAEGVTMSQRKGPQVETHDDERGVIIWPCFHRCAFEHGLPVCHGENPGDGEYRLPWLGSFQVVWEEARIHPLPEGFPIPLQEMRAREGYGTNTFLRVEGGWLFGTDLWHYDGTVGFVSDVGEVQEFAPVSVNVAAIIETQFGITLLGQNTFGGGEGGVLAVLTRDEGHEWHYEELLELPSEAFGYAFAPDGTLLVKDPNGAVAITPDRQIWPLDCGPGE